MRLIFASVGAHGHMIPLLPLALAARDAGHQVAFATAEEFHPLLSGTGLEPLAVGSTVGQAIAEAYRSLRGGAGAEASPLAFGSILPRRAIADLAPVLEGAKPDLVVYEALNPGAGIAARLAGVPAVCHGIGRVSGGANWKAMSNTWIATAEDFGLAVPAAEPQILGDPYLDICPPSLQLPAVAASDSRIAMRPVVWNQGGDLPRSVKERDTGRPLVYVTLGTALVKAEVLREAVEGLSRLPVDVLVSAGRKVAVEELGEVSDWVQVEEWVPQGDLLPLVDLVVSHGGSGTMLGALACGVPHLVIPQGADQFSNAQVLVDAGLGRRILPAELGAEVVRTEAEALLDDQLTFARVSDLSREVAGMPAPAEALQRLVELTR